MCGIAGFVDTKQTKPKQTIEKMTRTLAHRGPDGEGFFIDGPVALGHRRLSILDVSDAGSQPMKNASGSVVISHNGEIYNYIELKKKLLKKPYKSGTDTEVMIRAYEKWGTDCVKEFNGIFGFALWDKKKKTLFAARDHLGVKPFYYTLYKGQLYFASEIKAFLAAGIPAKPNDKIIYDYLVHGFYDHDEETFFKNIKQLMPGHSLTFKNGTLTIERYWHLPDTVRELSYASDKEYAEHFLALVKDAVKLQLRSDVPVGMSISGGLDSSLLMATVDKIVKGQKNFHSFHFKYTGKEYTQELPAVRRMVKRVGWKPADVVDIHPQDMPELANHVMWHEEQPYPGLPTIGWHKLYRHLGTTDTIVTLEGHGGDEMAAGYDYFFGSFLLDTIRTRGSAYALKEIEALQKVRKLDINKTLPFLLNGIEAMERGGVSADASRFTNTACLSSHFLKKNKHEPEFEKPFDSHLSNFQYRELMHTKLPRVLRSVDRESMAYGRELRVPLLDHRIVSFALSLPLEQRIRGGSQRVFMRNAGNKLVPSKQWNIPKRSMPIPQRAWFQKELRPWVESLLYSDSFRSRPYFNHKEIKQEYKRYCKEKNPANSFHIWQWMSIELWHRTFID